MRNIVLVLVSIILSFFISSCCVSKITLEEKEKWNKEIYGEEPFLRNQIPPVKVNLKEFYNYDGYIFPKEYYPFGGSRFTPTIEEIKKAEALLNKKRKSLPQLKKINFKKRYRQYIGNYNEDNKKVIQINFIKINKGCLNTSEYKYLIDKWFIQTSDYIGQWKIYLFDRVIID